MVRVRRYRLTATLLVAAWLYAAGLPLFIAPHFEGDDIACGDVGWPLSASSTKFSQAVTATGDGHCAVCHLQRALRHALVSAPSAIRDLGRTSSDPVPVRIAFTSYSVQHSASRGPPSL